MPTRRNGRGETFLLHSLRDEAATNIAGKAAALTGTGRPDEHRSGSDAWSAIVSVRRVVASLLMLMLSGQAAAEWVQLAESSGITVYFDAHTISRDGTVKVLTLRDHKNPTTNLRGWFYRSEKVRIEFDCQGKLVRELFSTLYTGQMGRGVVVGNEPSTGWKPIAPESVDEELGKRACGKQ